MIFIPAFNACSKLMKKAALAVHHEQSSKLHVEW
jgi:hypothetical protein